MHCTAEKDRRLLPVHSTSISLIETPNLWFKLAVQERYKLSLFLRLLSRSTCTERERVLTRDNSFVFPFLTFHLTPAP
jgi:hypothetical protein